MTEVRLARRPHEDLQLLAIREVLRATAAAPPLDEILTVIANMTIIVFDATTSWFMLAEDGRLRTVVARGEFGEELAGTVCADSSSGSCRAAASDRPAILQPQEIDPRDPLIGVFAGQDESVILVPLRSGARILGLLGSAVTPEATLDISFLVTVAEQATTAIESARLREETRSWRQRLDAVFERMAEAVLVYDREGRLALMNAAGEELLAGRNVVLGDTIGEVTRKAGLTDARGRPLRAEEAGASRALRGERVDNLEEDLPTASGSPRHLLISAMPLRSNDQVQGVVVVYRDITYIRELERMRAEFLSMVSHELRSPLTSVLGYAQLLERQALKGEPPRDLEKRLSVIVEQTKRVNALVEDLLEASRAEVGRLAMNMKYIDLLAIIRNTVGQMATLARGHRFRLELPDEVPPLRADPGRIEQVLRNLLSNAVKFSPPASEITLRLAVEAGRVVVSVSDQGVGISKEDVATLFLPFHRVRQAGGREVKGIGLGLFISRSIVEAHGGDMWVQSQVGKGSTFYFSLPLPRPRWRQRRSEHLSTAAPANIG